MNEQEKDLDKCEERLFDELLGVILYLNKNGIPLDSVREMILMKVDTAFIAYEEHNLRDEKK
jgi:NTP pyrophosphatase (non-canonical NTP hydrolase)